MSDVPIPTLLDFAATWSEQRDEVPQWAHPASAVPLAHDELGLRDRLEDVLDTVVSLQRADWLEDGVYVGPRSMPEAYRDLLYCARQLQVAVPPAVVSPIGSKRQATYGTDSRAFLHLSSFFLNGTQKRPKERRFQIGRLCGHIAAHQVTAGTLYALVTDANGLRKVARRAVGPALELVLAPLSLGVRLGLSRWHRAAEISADRAGLVCAGSLKASGRVLLRHALGVRPDFEPDDYLEALRQTHDGHSPGRWAEMLADEPFLHKRMQALQLFTRSQVWVDITGKEVADPMSREELDERTSALLGVS